MKSDWVVKALGQVCQIRPPKSEAHSRLAKAKNDLVSFVPMENLGIDQKFLSPSQSRRLTEVVGSYTYFADGDVLLAKITPCFENGKLGIAAHLVNGIGFGSSEYIVFRPDSTMDKEWLYYFLSRERFRSEGATQMHGAVGHKRVAKEFIDSCQIPVPPIHEQKRIIGILDNAFEGIAIAKANAEKNLQNVRALFESYSQDVFSRRGKDWQRKCIDDVCAIGDGNHSSKYPRKDELVARGIPFIRATNLLDGRISGVDMRFLSPEKHAQLKKGHLKTGDILITNRGDIGKIALVDSEYDNANLNSQIAWLRCCEQLNNIFLFHLLSSSEYQQYFGFAKSGAALQQFTIKQLKALVIPLPPVNEQQKIVGELNTISSQTKHLGNIYRQKLAGLDALKTSLLHQAFSGNL